MAERVLVQQLTAKRCREAARVIAHAYDTNPTFEYIFVEQRQRRLEWMFERWARVLALAGSCYISDCGRAVSLWRPPAVSQLTRVSGQVWGGLLFGPAPLFMGTRSILRAFRLGANMQRLRSHFVRPYWFLDVVAVMPEHQGLGLGRHLMDVALVQADDQHLPCCLITHSLENVKYFGRYGFDVVGEAQVPRGPHAWAMRRAPQPKSAREVGMG